MRRLVPALLVGASFALAPGGALADPVAHALRAPAPPAAPARRAPPVATPRPVRRAPTRIPVQDVEGATYKHLRRSADGELVVQLPGNPTQLFELAATKEGRPAFVARMGDEFLRALRESGGDGFTRRYEHVTRELGELVAKSPDAGKVDHALSIMRTYVEAGEQTNAFAAKGKTPGFYKEFNAALRGSSSMADFRAQHPEKAAFFFDELLPAYEALPGKVKGIVFRGTALPPDVAKRLAAGGETTFEQLAPLSTSVSLADALTFLGKTRGAVPTLMVIKTRSGKLVSWKDAAFGFEEEVLLMGREGVKLKIEAAFMAQPPRADEDAADILYLLLEER